MASWPPASPDCIRYSPRADYQPGDYAMQDVLQAGGIVFRLQDGTPRVLIVTARRNPGEWIFPKGHVEAGEAAGAAAVREVEEEAGVRAELLDFVGSLGFPSTEGTVRVGYFIMRFVANTTTTERRRVRWRTFDKALSLLTFDDSRRLLERARPLIEKQLFPPPGPRHRA